MFQPKLRSWGVKALPRRFMLLIGALLILTTTYTWHRTGSLKATTTTEDEAYYPEAFPLAWKHVHLARGPGGAWYIPPHWMNPSDPRPSSILEAAHLAYKLAVSSPDSPHTIPQSQIPLIVHQTWKDTKVNTWPRDLADGVEQWLSYAMAAANDSMAYFFWLDDGCKQVIAEAEPQIVEMVEALPMKVEKSDIFRIVVLNSIGGIYGDIDTLPLRSPASWLDETDVAPWTDSVTGKNYGPPSSLWIARGGPAQILLGIEGDNDPNTDTYWRMGYNFPVQLTQWALASGPRHPILNGLLITFARRMRELAEPYGGDFAALGRGRVLKKEDPLKLTGPEAITVAAMDHLKKQAGLRWESLTGLVDGGRSKIVDDAIILPITAFSPGRGKYGNMGSKPITHPDARILHRAQGSWKSFNLKVEIGKACRTFLGQCKDWPKVPG